MTSAIRKLLPYTLLPLSLISCVLASAPWLRAFPSDVMAVPLFGAAVFSVLTPVIVVGIGVRKLWQTALIDLVLFVLYELVVTLREPAGFHHLYVGLIHGPAQILSFALPLMSPRTLLVAPVALCWVSGALIGECVARGWQSVLPYLTLVVTFGLAYAGTVRAITSASDGRRYDTLLAAALLLALLLLRAAQAWVVQDESAEMTQPEGILPLRGLVIGTMLAIAVAAAAAGVGQTSVFAGHPVVPARVPPLDQTNPLTPVAFIAGLRPEDPDSKGKELFKISTDRRTSNYVAIASVDYYDGDAWSFTNRTFRPSGGVIPADPDPDMRPRGPQVTQQYRIDDGPMTTAPWMPHLDRAQRVTGVAVNIDSTTGMIVPANPLRAGADYTVKSSVPRKDFGQLGSKDFISTSAPQVDTTLANGLSTPLGALISSLEAETGTSSQQPIAFLQAVANEFRTKAALAGGTASSTPSPGQSTPGARFLAPSHTSRPAQHKSPTRTPHPTTPSPTPSPTTAASGPPHTGGTTFADVLASIRASHAGTPEQFATLTALVARRLNVPAVVVSGFRVPLSKGATQLGEGTHAVHAADAWTWVEIPVRGQGWVVLDPSPGTYSSQTPPHASAIPSPSPSPSPSKNALVTHANNGGNAVAPPSHTPHAKNVSGIAIAVIVLIGLVLFAVLVLCFLLARKQVRLRRRRRGGDPRRRLLGAWQESLDVLVESGLPDLTTATTAEVAQATEARFGDDPAQRVRFVGDAANVAIFSPTSWIGPEDADAAWQAQSQLTKAVRRELGLRDRFGAHLRYNQPRRAKAGAGPESWAEEAKSRSLAGRGKHARRRRFAAPQLSRRAPDRRAGPG
jgi:hypothetical protein